MLAFPRWIFLHTLQVRLRKNGESKARPPLPQKGITAVPQHLQDATRDARALGHGQGYQYPHENPDHYLPQQYLPRPLLGTYFYNPSQQGYEAQVVERLERWRQAQRLALGIEDSHTLPELPEETIKDIKGKHKPS